MSRRRRTLTREDLLHRYATVRGLTYGEAHDLHAGTEIEDLRSIVESAEDQRRPPWDELRAEFKPPTTDLDGQTR